MWGRDRLLQELASYKQRYTCLHLDRFCFIAASTATVLLSLQRVERWMSRKSSKSAIRLSSSASCKLQSLTSLLQLPSLPKSGINKRKAVGNPTEAQLQHVSQAQNASAVTVNPPLDKGKKRARVTTEEEEEELTREDEMEVDDSFAPGNDADCLSTNAHSLCLC